MITMKWSLRSDSHRRIRVYKTRPVAAEAQGLGKWRSHVDLHHELPASQTGVQNYLHLESMASVIGLAPTRPGLKDRLRELLCIHGLPFVKVEWKSWSSRAVTLRGLPLIKRALCS